MGRILGPVLTVTFFSILVAYAATKGYKLVLISSIVPLLSVVVS
jgi:ion channel-forming bestrophin family protein